jgi:hypothetical protein
MTEKQLRMQPPRDPISEWEPPKGYTIEWADDPGCRVATTEENANRWCRRPGCRRRPVMALHRSSGWWLYCD